MKAETLAKLNLPVPRYTSYPTAPNWNALDENTYREKLDACDEASLYIHIPFCHSMCLYCGCSVVLNRKPENEEKYVEALCKEIELIDRNIPSSQLHFGGGTPTKLSCQLLTKLMDKLTSTFAISGEVAMEVDPRSVDAAKLHHLKSLGFNRISIGVQDTDPEVQHAVRRNQSLALTTATYNIARTLFDHINIDLIYGLPYQTHKTFEKTIQDIIAMRPNRIAMFSYAKVPWLKPHQKAIKEETLPSTLEKFKIYMEAREELQRAGYIAIGMDHFALPNDSLIHKRHRNFQGYTTNPSRNLIGLGITAIGEIGSAYFQNAKDLKSYYAAIENNQLATHRGHVLTKDDLIRRYVINQLMCNFTLDKSTFQEKFDIPFDTYFSVNLPEELITTDGDRLIATDYGELFIRNVASYFDAYLINKPHRFSKAV